MVLILREDQFSHRRVLTDPKMLTRWGDSPTLLIPNVVHSVSEYLLRILGRLDSAIERTTVGLTWHIETG